MFTNFCGIPWCCRIFQSDGRCRLTKAFSKSMNMTYKELFHSCDCSRIWRRTKMWPMYDLSFLKPACSWRSSMSTAVVMSWRMMRQKTLLAMDSSVMPLQLLHSDRFPFLGSLVITPLFHTAGVTSLFQTSRRMCWRSCGISCSSAFSISVCTLTSHGALPFFSLLIVSLTSWTVIGQSTMSMSCSASPMSASISRSHWLMSYWKCSHHLSSFAFSSVMIDPTFIFIMMSWFSLLSPRSFLVIW